MQAATNPPPDSDVLHPTRQQLLALRIVAYSIAIEHLEVVNSLLLGGRMPFNFLHDHWTSAVQDYLDGKPLFEVFTVESYLDIMALLPSTQYQVILIDKNGRRLADRAVTSLKHEGGKGVELPVDMHVVHEAVMIVICLPSFGLTALALVDMIWGALIHGISVFGLIDGTYSRGD